MNAEFHLYLALNQQGTKPNVKLTLFCCRTAQEKTEKYIFSKFVCESSAQMCLKLYVYVYLEGRLPLFYYKHTFFFFFFKVTLRARSITLRTNETVNVWWLV